MSLHRRLSSCPAFAALVALALSAGCSAKDSPTAPPGDTGGVHLLVFASDRGQSAGQLDLFLYDLDAGGFRLIRNINSATVPDLHPSLSSDGLVIAFQSNRGGGNQDIQLYSRALQQVVALPNVNTAADETDPVFTGDAIKLAFTQRAANGFTRIRLYDGLGDTLMPLTGLDTTATYNDWAPSPNQNGGRIAFVSDRNGNPDLFVWDAATKTLLDLPNLNSTANDVDPCMTWDSRYLCFASDRAGGAGGYDLYLYDLLGKSFVTTIPAAVQSTADERHPALSQSAGLIVFQSNRTGLGGWDLWNYQASSGIVGQATQESSTGDDVDPALLYP